MGSQEKPEKETIERWFESIRSYPLYPILEASGLTEELLYLSVEKAITNHSRKTVLELSKENSEQLFKFSAKALHSFTTYPDKIDSFATQLLQQRNNVSSLLNSNREKAKNEANRYIRENLGFPLRKELDPEIIINALSDYATFLQSKAQMIKELKMQFENQVPNALALLVLLPRLKELEADEFLELLEKDVVKLDFSSPDDYVSLMYILLTMGRPDVIPRVHLRLALSLEKGSKVTETADRYTVNQLLERKWETIADSALISGQAGKTAEMLLNAMRLMLSKEVDMIPIPDTNRYINQEIARSIRADIWCHFGEIGVVEFGKLLNRSISEIFESYTWQGFKRSGQVFTALSTKQFEKHMNQVESRLKDVNLTPAQRKVFELEIILALRNEKWPGDEKAKWLGVKQAIYRQHLHQARKKLKLAQQTEHLTPYERLLRTIFSEDLTAS